MSQSTRTQRAYEDAWNRFSEWCVSREVEPLLVTPETIVIYLGALASGDWCIPEDPRPMTPPTVEIAHAAICYTIRRAGMTPPQQQPGSEIINEVIAGIRRSRTTPIARKAAACADVIQRILWSIQGDDLQSARDRAIVAFGMATACRRSELVALDVADLEWEARGVRVRIRRSKTDQEAVGQVIAVPKGRRLKPVAHLRAWLDAAGITEGAVFRPVGKDGKVRASRLTAQSIRLVMCARAEAAGFDAGVYSAHSLRAGFVTSAARAGADVFKIREVSRHKSLQVLAGYVREERLFEGHAGDGFF